MSGEEGKDKTPRFDLKGAGGEDFEQALRRAEESLEAPVPSLVRYDSESGEALDDVVVGSVNELAGEIEEVEEAETTVHLQLTLREETALVGEFSGAEALRAATPAEDLGDGDEPVEAFQEIPRSGADVAAEESDDWLEPLDPEDWSANAPVGGLTGDPGAGLLGDFSGAEAMPPEPEEEEEAFVNDGLPSLTAAEGDLLSEFSGAELYGEDAEEEPPARGMSAIDQVIFSSDPRASEPTVPRVTGRTEPEFIFKR